MHTVELLEEALVAAQRLGYRVRQEWLGTNSSACTIRGQKWLFLDLAQGPLDQLHAVLDALREESEVATLRLPEELTRLVQHRRAA